MRLLEFLRQHNIDTRGVGQHHHATPRFVQVDCPWCSPRANRFRCGLALNGRISVCWTCGFHPLIKTLSEVSGLSGKEIRRILEVTPDVRIPLETIRGTLVEPKGVEGFGSPHKRYLTIRGLDIDTVKNFWECGAIGIHGGHLSWRIYIPIILDGEQVSWTTRSIGDHPQRYLSAPPQSESISHRKLLYGEDFVGHSVIVTEGPIDVWKVGPGAVATFGISFTRAQVLKLAKYPKRAICFDNEKEAQKRARELASLLEPFPGETSVVTLDSGKDAGEASDKELAQLRRIFLD